jgi:hypothetical protein
MNGFGLGRYGCHANGDMDVPVWQNRCQGMDQLYPVRRKKRPAGALNSVVPEIRSSLYVRKTAAGRGNNDKYCEEKFFYMAHPACPRILPSFLWQAFT